MGGVAMPVELKDEPTGADQPAAPHVRLRGVSKTYALRPALVDIDLDIARGSVHALVGENGAGKSTLGKIIAGVTARTAGELEVDGRSVDFHSPRDALRRGVTAITQELSLVADLSVLDNVFLGLEQARLGMRRNAPLRHRYEKLAELAGFGPDPGKLVAELSLAEQQQVEILRALARDARLLVFDEPTTVLDGAQTERLHAMIRRLRDRGTTIVYVSHFLEEVLALADAVTVLRDGHLIQTTSAATQTPTSLILAMLGRDLGDQFPPKVKPAPEAPVVLEARQLASGRRLHDVSLQLRRGEILGVAGLVGSGRTELLRAIFGADRLSGGLISLDTKAIRIDSPRRAIAAGIAFVPEDRRAQGLVTSRSIQENVTLATLDRVCDHGLVRTRLERQTVAEMIDRIQIRCRGPRSAVEELSGGNQQKVLFAKWLLARPRILLADEPTRGVDVGAKRAIYDLLAELASQGTAILLVSSEVEEIVGLATRVIVLKQGRQVAELTGSDIREDRITSAAFGNTEAMAA
jgi:simple sugar transport system ATP-binding protein/ribose transport system ATP-binding protein